MTIATYQGIRDLADAYDHWIIDLWGVLHDGATPYPGAIDTLNTLKQQGKTIILLSNAPRRAFKAESVLESLGFDQSSYDTVITSGELTYHYLQAHTDYGKHYYYIGPPKDEDLLDGLPYVRVMEPVDADFALVTGFDEFGDPIESKLPQVEHCLKYELPMVCTNPDRKVVKQDGRVMLCAGLLGEWYQENGGKVQFFGKPYASAYASCMAYFGTGDTSRIIAVGDSIHTDIAGARLSNITALLVAGGILAGRSVSNAFISPAVLGDIQPTRLTQQDMTVLNQALVEVLKDRETKGLSVERVVAVLQDETSPLREKFEASIQTMQQGQDMRVLDAGLADMLDKRGTTGYSEIEPVSYTTGGTPVRVSQDDINEYLSTMQQNMDVLRTKRDGQIEALFRQAKYANGVETGTYDNVTQTLTGLLEKGNYKSPDGSARPMLTLTRDDLAELATVNGSITAEKADAFAQHFAQTHPELMHVMQMGGQGQQQGPTRRGSGQSQHQHQNPPAGGNVPSPTRRHGGSGGGSAVSSETLKPADANDHYEALLVMVTRGGTVSEHVLNETGNKKDAAIGKVATDYLKVSPNTHADRLKEAMDKLYATSGHSFDVTVKIDGNDHTFTLDRKVAEEYLAVSTFEKGKRGTLRAINAHESDTNKKLPKNDSFEQYEPSQEALQAYLKERVAHYEKWLATKEKPKVTEQSLPKRNTPETGKEVDPQLTGEWEGPKKGFVPVDEVALDKAFTRDVENAKTAVLAETTRQHGEFDQRAEYHYGADDSKLAKLQQENAENVTVTLEKKKRLGVDILKRDDKISLEGAFAEHDAHKKALFDQREADETEVYNLILKNLEQRYVVDGEADRQAFRERLREEIMPAVIGNFSYQQRDGQNQLDIRSTDDKVHAYLQEQGRGDEFTQPIEVRKYVDLLAEVYINPEITDGTISIQMSSGVRHQFGVEKAEEIFNISQEEIDTIVDRGGRLIAQQSEYAQRMESAVEFSEQRDAIYVNIAKAQEKFKDDKDVLKRLDDYMGKVGKTKNLEDLEKLHAKGKFEDFDEMLADKVKEVEVPASIYTVHKGGTHLASTGTSMGDTFDELEKAVDKKDRALLEEIKAQTEELNSVILQRQNNPNVTLAENDPMSINNGRRVANMYRGDEDKLNLVGGTIAALQKDPDITTDDLQAVKRKFEEFLNDPDNFLVDKAPPAPNQGQEKTR